MELPLLCTEGLYVCIALSVAAIIGWIFIRPLFYITLAFFLFAAFFFRNPDRRCPPAALDSHLVISPADGTIIEVSNDTLDYKEYATRISIFLSIFDAHVIWAPMAGEIESMRYTPGIFTFAFLPKSAKENERHEVVIKAHNGKKIMLRLIAGTIARRISCWTHEKEFITSCQKIGMIRFGSRVDILVPRKTNIFVKEGDYVRGGESIIGQLI